jgi:hypothetical protein
MSGLKYVYYKNKVNYRNIKFVQYGGGYWICSLCTLHNDDKNSICTLCDTHKPSQVPKPIPTLTSLKQTPSTDWTCPICTFINIPSNTKCGMCGATQSQSPPKQFVCDVVEHKSQSCVEKQETYIFKISDENDKDNGSIYHITTNKVEAKGNCMYYSIITGLRNANIMSYNVNEEGQCKLRNDIYNYVYKNAYIVKKILRPPYLDKAGQDKESNDNYISILANIRTSKKYDYGGADALPQIISIMLKVNINIYIITAPISDCYKYQDNVIPLDGTIQKYVFNNNPTYNSISIINFGCMNAEKKSVYHYDVITKIEAIKLTKF